MQVEPHSTLPQLESGDTLIEVVLEELVCLLQIKEKTRDLTLMQVVYGNVSQML